MASGGNIQNNSSASALKGRKGGKGSKRNTHRSGKRK